MEDKQGKQIASDEDRTVLRTYLNKRLNQIAVAQRARVDAEEKAYNDGALMEMILAYDELLGEQVPSDIQERLR